MRKQNKRSIHLVIYPSVLIKFKTIAHLKGLSLSKTLEFFIDTEFKKYSEIDVI